MELEKSKISDLFLPGTVIWRQCLLLASSGHSRIELPVFEFVRAQKHWMARIQYPGLWLPEPEAVPVYTENGAPRSGVVMFLDDLPPDDWTCMKVTGLSKALTDGRAGSRTSGGALFVAPVVDAPAPKDYIYGRRWLWDHYRNMKMTFEEALEGPARWIDWQCPSDLQRLFIVTGPDGVVECDHID